MSLCHFQQRDLNKNASRVSNPEAGAHALSLQTVFCEARRSHWSKIWLKHLCVFAMRSFLRNTGYSGSAKQALLPNPHHLCRFMDNLVLT